MYAWRMEAEEDLYFEDMTPKQQQEYHRDFEFEFRKYCYGKIVQSLEGVLDGLSGDKSVWGYIRSDPHGVLETALAKAIVNSGGPKPPKIPRSVSAKKRVLVRERCGSECAWCGATRNLVIDHIRPVELGGNSRLHNLQVLCQACNSAKRDRFA